MKAILGALAVSSVLACAGSKEDLLLGAAASGGSGGTSAVAATLGGSSGAGAAAGDGGSAGNGGNGDPATAGAGSSPESFTLGVTVHGDGRVTSTPPGIDCGASCTAMFSSETEMDLVPHEQGGAFRGWSGACGSASCSGTLALDTFVTATFEPFAVGENAHGVAVTPDGTRALVTLENSAGKLMVILLSDGTLIDSIDVGAFPSAVAVTPDGSKAVVNNRNSVSVVTLATRAVATVASPCVGDTLYDIAVTPDGTRAVTTMFYGNCTSNSVAVIALDTATLQNQYALPAQLTGGIAVTADGASALVSLGILGTKVSRVALAGGAITDISNTSSSFGIAVTPDGSEALVASGDGDTIKRVSLGSNSVSGSIDYASNQDPHDIAITPDGTLAVVVGSFDVGVLSLATGMVRKTFSGGGRSVAITPDGKRALVTLGSKLRVYSLAL